MKAALKGVAKNTNHRLNDLFGKDPEVKYPDAFYFRITRDWTLYYTSSKADTLVLGVMVPHKMKMKFLSSMACFEVFLYMVNLRWKTRLKKNGHFVVLKMFVPPLGKSQSENTWEKSSMAVISISTTS